MMMKGSVVSQGPCKSVDCILEGEMRAAYTDNSHDPHLSVESENTIRPPVIEDVPLWDTWTDINRWPPAMV